MHYSASLKSDFISLHPLQVENCDSNLGLFVDEDENAKFKLLSKQLLYMAVYGPIIIRVFGRDSVVNVVTTLSHRLVKIFDCISIY